MLKKGFVVKFVFIFPTTAIKSVILVRCQNSKTGSTSHYIWRCYHFTGLLLQSWSFRKLPLFCRWSVFKWLQIMYLYTPCHFISYCGYFLCHRVKIYAEHQQLNQVQWSLVWCHLVWKWVYIRFPTISVAGSRFSLDFYYYNSRFDRWVGKENHVISPVGFSSALGLWVVRSKLHWDAWTSLKLACKFSFFFR